MATVFSVDAHAAGEACRVVVGGVPFLPGTSLESQRQAFRERHDWIRTALMWEPRGHSHMFGCLLRPPVREGSLYGLIFFDTAAYLDGCGHGTLCSIAVWNRIHGEPSVPFEIDNPDGTAVRVTENDTRSGGCAATLEMPPARVLSENVPVPEHGEMKVAIAHCGNTYVLVPAVAAGLTELRRTSLSRVQKKAAGVRRALSVRGNLAAESSPEIAFYQRRDGEPMTFTTAVVFSGSQIDRSPCGTGSSALLATLLQRGEIGAGETMRTVGPAGQEFRLVSDGSRDGSDGYRIRLRGEAYVTGLHEWVVDDSDPLRTGFQLNDHDFSGVGPNDRGRDEEQERSNDA